jgi:hypothetical protein
VVSARHSFGRAVAGLGVVAGLVLTSGACTTHKQEPAASTATLTAVPAELGECAPDRLARCVPGLADVEQNLSTMSVATRPDWTLPQGHR